MEIEGYRWDFLPQFDLPVEEFTDCLADGELLTVPLLEEEKKETSGPEGPVPSPSLDLNDNEDIPTELSDSSETHDEGISASILHPLPLWGDVEEIGKNHTLNFAIQVRCRPSMMI